MFLIVLIEKTAKKLLVCRVVWPPEQLSFIELDSLSQFRFLLSVSSFLPVRSVTKFFFSVDDMVMSRWLPKG